MKRSLKEIARLTSNNLKEEKIGQLAKTVWRELQTNKKFGNLDALLAQIRKLEAAKADSKIAEIYSTKELETPIKDELVKKLEQRTKSKILPIYKTNKRLLGGIKIKVEDEVIDVSWQGKLQLIKAKLETGQ